ncbi:hypothetical protein NPIL_36211 [Nephila pilipes]|uniref:Uncharacterized protein n=1 Tax=Nephila pilipes TaxID=299642 RepID=A0A8X6T888_NEPPI|nr:hypothetical protein NPIL_36211 [Nephila pilipes]
MGFFEHSKINCSGRNNKNTELKTSHYLSSNYEENDDITRILNGMNSTLNLKTASGNLRNTQNNIAGFQNLYHPVSNYLPPIKAQDLGECSNIPCYNFQERRVNSLNYSTLPDLSASSPSFKNPSHVIWSTEGIRKAREKVLDRLLKSSPKDVDPDIRNNDSSLEERCQHWLRAGSFFDESEKS